MIGGLLTLLSFVSAVFFPWPVTAVVAVAVSWTEPLVPLAVGLFADSFYYTPSSGGLPLATIGGALVTALVFFVRSRVMAGSIKR